jgi:hypothetical protein
MGTRPLRVECPSRIGAVRGELGGFLEIRVAGNLAATGLDRHLAEAAGGDGESRSSGTRRQGLAPLVFEQTDLEVEVAVPGIDEAQVDRLVRRTGQTNESLYTPPEMRVLNKWLTEITDTEPES